MVPYMTFLQGWEGLKIGHVPYGRPNSGKENLPGRDQIFSIFVNSKKKMTSRGPKIEAYVMFTACPFVLMSRLSFKGTLEREEMDEGQI